MSGWSKRRFDLCKQYFYCQPARLIEVLGNGCQICIFSHIKIIETNHSQLFWHLNAQMARSLKHS